MSLGQGSYLVHKEKVNFLSSQPALEFMPRNLYIHSATKLFVKLKRWERESMSNTILKI